jgi:hypothetical protein
MGCKWRACRVDKLRIKMHKSVEERLYLFLFHPVSNFNTLRHQFESGKTQKTAKSVAIGNTKVTIAITIIQV